MRKNNPIGVLQGRLTSSNGRGIQFFPFGEWENEFALADEIGFDTIELLVKKDSYERNPLWNEDGIKKIEELKKKHHIQTPSVHGFFLKDTAYPDVFSKIIEQASKVGARTVLVSFFNENILQNEEDMVFAKKHLKKPLERAERLGIKLGIETEMAADTLKTFIDLFESTSVGVYYDIGNMVSMNVDVVKEIHFWSNRIVGVHVKDRTKNGGGSVPLGEGDSDFVSVFKALKNIGYNGPLVLQGARSEKIDDITLNKRYFEYVKGLLETVKNEYGERDNS